jgi:hypothetical protein
MFFEKAKVQKNISTMAPTFCHASGQVLELDGKQNARKKIRLHVLYLPQSRLKPVALQLSYIDMPMYGRPDCSKTLALAHYTRPLALTKSSLDAVVSLRGGVYQASGFHIRQQRPYIPSILC